MVFMEDSERAAELARDTELDIGLHLNFMERFTGRNCPELVLRYQSQTQRFLTWNKYTRYFYNPFLRRAFREVYEAQVDEFKRLYKRDPSHFDGHQHMHLCTNMLIHQTIPSGEKVRGTFSFWPGEKSGINRFGRRWVSRLIASRYQTTDSFFSLSQCLRYDRVSRVAEQAKVCTTELMTHPERPQERAFLLSDECVRSFSGIRMTGYRSLASSTVFAKRQAIQAS